MFCAWPPDKHQCLLTIIVSLIFGNAKQAGSNVLFCLASSRSERRRDSIGKQESQTPSLQESERGIHSAELAG